MQSFGKPSILIIGCGDIGLRVAKQLSRSHRVFALTSSQNRFQELREVGATPMLGNLDHPETLWRLSGLAQTVIHLAPPQNQGNRDCRTRNLLRILSQGSHVVRRLIYISTTGVYGDHQGQWVDESSTPTALGSQGQLRLAAENKWVSFAKAQQVPLTIFRLAGIYGPERNVLARIIAGKKDTIVKEGHFFSRIHVDDIVLAIVAAMQHPKPGVCIYNVADDEPAPSHVVDEYAATLLKRPPLKRVAYEMATLSPMAQEFYSHHKRVSNAKLKRELNIQLTYPTYKEGLNHLLHNEGYLCQ